MDDCVSLERFSKLSNFLEQKDTPGLLQSMHLSNCNRLMDNLGIDMVSKMAKALLNQVLVPQLMYDGLYRGECVKCWKLMLPRLPEIDVPKWFDSGEGDTSVLRRLPEIDVPKLFDRGEGDTSVPPEIRVDRDEVGDCKNDICEILIKIPRNLKGEGRRLVVCVVFEITQDGSCGCEVTVVINKQQYGGGYDYILSSARDRVYVCLTCIEFMELEVVDHMVRVTFRKNKGMLLKSFGVHLANMKQNNVRGEDLAPERYRQSNASISDFENAEGAAVASLVSEDSFTGEVQDDHHDGEQEQEQEPHLPTKRFEDLARQTNIGRAMLALLRCLGITTCF